MFRRRLVKANIFSKSNKGFSFNLLKPLLKIKDREEIKIIGQVVNKIRKDVLQLHYLLHHHVVFKGKPQVIHPGGQA